ncbi:ATP-binding cassette domain-containing protein [Corynebacterium macginleyi]|uniref:ABC transporter ATP-binding protein n=1 Tax=Corynebacterium macginleyi TaxID=38290 RepID=UPI00190BFDC0|nr:ATP-binding cassette domain-containing protein [Corynebacterium macginleyi]QRJ57994.1 ATP-binding cassette domain-containing protein [Corynebacterium macginleyi]
MNILLESNNLRYSPTNKLALRYPDFVVNRGDTVAIEGPNGSGKTTLLFLIAGLYPADSNGSLKFTDPTAGTHRLNRAKCGLSLPGVADNPSLSGKAVIRSSIKLAGREESEARKVLDSSGIEQFWHQRFGRCSTGQKLRLMLAQAFLSTGPLVLLDEPTNGLDKEGVRWLQEQIDAASDAGRAVLATKHDDQLRFNKKILVGGGK